MMAGKITRYDSTGNTKAAIRSTAQKCTEYSGIDDKAKIMTYKSTGTITVANNWTLALNQKVLATGNDTVAAKTSVTQKERTEYTGVNAKLRYPCMPSYCCTYQDGVCHTNVMEYTSVIGTVLCSSVIVLANTRRRTVDSKRRVCSVDTILVLHVPRTTIQKGAF